MHSPPEKVTLPGFSLLAVAPRAIADGSDGVVVCQVIDMGVRSTHDIWTMLHT